MCFLELGISGLYVQCIVIVFIIYHHHHNHYHHHNFYYSCPHYHHNIANSLDFFLVRFLSHFFKIVKKSLLYCTIFPLNFVLHRTSFLLDFLSIGIYLSVGLFSTSQFCGFLKVIIEVLGLSSFWLKQIIVNSISIIFNNLTIQICRHQSMCS